MKQIVVVGAGGHAKSVIDVIEKQAVYSIIGLLDENKPKGQWLYGYEIAGGLEWLKQHADEISGLIIAIGDNWTRARIESDIMAIHPALAFATAVHPSAQIAKGARIGAGSVVMAGSVIGSDAQLGRHSVVCSQVSIDHDCVSGDFVSWAPRSASGGDTTVGAYSAIAIGASIIHGITIGEHCVIGAGATVTSSISSHTVAYGTPARHIRSRAQGERYL